MTKNNGMPIEVNKKSFEAVQELKDEYQVPSFEEFMKTYENDEGVIEGYENEIKSYGDIGVNRSYGPGSNQSSYSDNSDQARTARHTVKVAVGVASNVASKVAGPAAPMITGAVTSVVGEIGHALSSDSDFKDA
ncbi:6479_t:CDS:1 [Ambispora gerdemannii]|uniref:6479_t:CDS:1 n=1 Tax=Ambispora gerdemannii TaxID=144530 RepID=A0A9N9GT90_9GLOM|nr:6479_t:CDS:1 [Ambispora gerdemannii]